MNKTISRLRYGILPLCLALLCTMCSQPDLSGDVDLLELSVSGIREYPAGALDEVIEVESNRADWSFVKSGDWLTVERDGDRLHLEADANSTTDSRMAQILVLSGKVSRKVEIHQQGGEGRLALSPAEARILSWSDRFEIDLSTDAESWSAETDAEWLSLTSIPQTGTLVVDVAANPDYDRRVAKIFFTFGDTGRREFTVTQEGREYYLLPCYDFLSDSKGVREFEFARGNSLISVSNPYVFTLNYSTRSSAFSLISYTIFNDDPMEEPSFDPGLEWYKHAEVRAADPNLLRDKRELEGLRRFLLSEGYSFNEELGWYEDLEHSVVATIDTEKSVVNFHYLPESEENYGTLEALPLDNLVVSTKEEMEAWEAEHGGVLDFSFKSESTRGASQYYYLTPSGPTYRFYVVNDKSGQIIFRGYQYEGEKPLALYEYDNTDFLTRPFIALLQREGFVFQSEIQHCAFDFYNATRGVHLIVHSFGDVLALQVE